MSENQRKKISDATVGRKAHNKGKPNPLAASNGKRGAAAMSAKATGRRKLTRPDGSWTWTYPKVVGSFDDKESFPIPA